MIVETYKHQIWAYLIDTIEYLLKIEENTITQEVAIGINYSVMLNITCLVEGFTEAKLKELLNFKLGILKEVDRSDFNKRIHYNTFIHSVESDIEQRISRCTGLNNYDFLYELLTDKKLSSYESFKEIWEGLKVLFNFRNVIAHGREVSASRIAPSWIGEQWCEHFNGGYKALETYLAKNKFIEKSFIESQTAKIFFKRNIVEHFWSLANIYIEKLDEVILDEFKNKKLTRKNYWHTT